MRWGKAAMTAGLVCVLLAPGAADAATRKEGSRWHVSFSAGGSDPRKEVRSDAANILTLLEPDGRVADRFLDLRDDALVTGTLSIQPTTVFALAVQYDVTRRLALEATVSWQEAAVGDVEVARYNPTFRATDLLRVEAGDLTRVPLELTALFRFRPEQTLAPYAGLGVGYSSVGFDTSPELDRLSVDLDRSAGFQVAMASENEGSFLNPINTVGPLMIFDGAQVDARDTFQWQAVAGTEYVLAPRWALFAELRYMKSSREVSVRFDQLDEIGIPVPEATVGIDSPAATAPYGPVNFTEGGLIDFTGDGVPDRGFYWVKGGAVGYDEFTARLGLRYSF